MAPIGERLRQWWLDINGSLWFVPGVMVLGAIALAVALVGVQDYIGDELFARWPLVFGAGRDGSREMLAAIASSMISVAGVVFSITVVVLSLASSQYTPRLLRNFMRDRTTQRVLGIFVGIYVYCLIVLRTIYDDDGDPFVPHLAVLGGLALALVGVAFLVSFIHHIALSVQASHILAMITADTERVIDRLYPCTLAERVGQPVASGATAALPSTDWSTLAARRAGYLQRIDYGLLEKFAVTHDVVIRVEYPIGAYVVEGLPLLSLSSDHELAAAEPLCSACIVSDQRTVEEDVGFGIRQIVDVALKGLSPSINDPTTAVMCIDRLEGLLVRLAQRHIEPPHRLGNGRWYVIAQGPGFAALVELALEQIVQYAADKPVVLRRLLRLCETLLNVTPPGERRQVVATQLSQLEAVVRAAGAVPPGCAAVLDEAVRLRVRATLDT